MPMPASATIEPNKSPPVPPASERSTRPSAASAIASSAARSSPMRWAMAGVATPNRSEEHTSELQSLMRISYAVFCLKKKKQNQKHNETNTQHTDKQHRHNHQYKYNE